jgi:hypothetical protein
VAGREREIEKLHAKIGELIVERLQGNPSLQRRIDLPSRSVRHDTLHLP